MTYLSTAILLIINLLHMYFSVALASSAPKNLITLDELDAEISEIARETKIPSLAYALLDKDQIHTIKVIGMADIDNKREANLNTVYRLGSISKMVASLAVLKLVEEGRLNLDDEVASLVPDVTFYNPWHDDFPVRLVHLLEHTSGWDELALKEFARKNLPTHTLSNNLEFYPQSRTSRWPAGTRAAYSNSGVAVTAKIIEKITGLEYEDYINEAIFTPLGIMNSTYHYDSNVKTNGAISYKGDQAQDYKHLIYRPAGAINSTITDAARLAQLFLRRGQPILNSKSIDRMERSESTNAGTMFSALGMNNSAAKYGPWVYYGHDGSVNGALSELRYLPEAGVGFVILINNDNSKALNRIVKKIVNYQTQELPLPQFINKTHSNNTSTDLQGYYYVVNTNVELVHFLSRIVAIYKIGSEENLLTIKGLLFHTALKKFAAINDNSFKSIEDGKVEIIKAVDPLAGQVLHYGKKVLKPTSAIILYGQLALLLIWILIVLFSMILSIYWGVYKLFNKKKSAHRTGLSLWVSLASLSAFIFLLSIVFGMQNPLMNMGNITLFSVSVMLSSITFGIFTLIAVYNCVKNKKASGRKLTHWYHVSCTVVHLVVVSYFLSFGVIGLRIWA